MPHRNYLMCILLIYSTSVVISAGDVEEKRSRKIIGASRKHFKAESRLERVVVTDQPNVTVSIKNGKLKFHEMVRIYHDIWNTILMGQSREYGFTKDTKNKHRAKERERVTPHETKPDLHQLFKIITPVDIVRDTLETVSAITKRKGIAHKNPSELFSKYNDSPVR